MYVKKKLTILTFYGIFIISYPYNSFALFKANIESESNKININDILRLNITIESDEGGELKMGPIKGLDENFEIVNESNSQGSNTKIAIINGKTETMTSLSFQKILFLKPKKNGNYEIGPANIFNGSKKIETNSIKINVSGDKLFVNGNPIQTPNGNNNRQNQTKIEKNDETPDFTKDIEKENFDENRNIYLFLATLLLILFSTYIIIKNNKEQNNIIDNDQTEEINYENKKNDYIYPEITDNNFIEKIEIIFKNKLKKKYNIAELENKTYDEIIDYVTDKDDKEKIKIISNKINKSKYSNLVNDDNNLAILIKNI